MTLVCAADSVAAMLRPSVALCLVLLFSGLGRAATSAGIKEFEVVGRAQAGAGGKVADKTAEDDALRGAVELAVKELAGEVKPEKQPVLAQKIYKQARRYVPEFRVLDRTEAGATVLLKVKAKVALDTLRADLVSVGIIVVEKQATVLTRVIVLPAPSKTGAAPWWAAGGAANAPEPHTYVLVEALRGKGFQVTEPRRPEPDPDATGTPTPAPSPEMSKENLLAVAKAYDVDVLVKMPWEVAVQMRPLDALAFALARAKVGPVEAIAVKDGSIVATANGEGVAGEALDLVKAKGAVPADVAARIQEQALRNAANDVALKLGAALGDPVAKGGAAASIRLVVAGLDSFVAFSRFEAALGTELKSVRGATLRSIERGEAIFEISLDRGVDALGFADEIAKKSFDDFSVKVTEKSTERVVVHVVR